MLHLRGPLTGREGARGRSERKSTHLEHFRTAVAKSVPKWERFPCISLTNRPELSGSWTKTEPDPGRSALNNFFLPHQTGRLALILAAMAEKNDSASIAEM